MAIKKYTNGSWVSASYRKYGTETDTITTLPATVIGDGTPISSYTIKGNTEQTGTPTPENPIMPSGCGEKTENLVESIEQGTWSTTGFVKTDTNTRCRIGNVIDVITEQSYTIHCETTGSTQGLVNIQYKNDLGASIGESGWKNLGTSGNYTATLPSGTTKITIILTLSPGNVNCSPLDFSNIMLNLGSTAPPYEPYGYKLPLTLGNTTTNIYLGEVQTTRRIKKLVLTGTENFTKNNTNPSNYLYYGPRNSIMPSSIEKTPLICDELPVTSEAPVSQIGISTNNLFNVIYINFGADVMNAQSSGNTVNGFKEYLAQQYANGTPVTIWYVLAEPETAVVNEPIRKIGDYVDSVSGTNLATSGTAQEFDVGTTLKPSEVDLTYHGWHEHEDTKYST